MNPEQKASFKRLTDYYKKVREAEKINLKIIDEIVELVNSILKRHQIEETINTNQIKYNEGFIGNVIDIEDKKLSKIIFDTIYPKPNNKYYSHYTTYQAALNILESEELWIFNLVKNFNADEFKLFYEEHNITGYRELKSTLGVKTDYRSIMSELYSLCLTTEDNESPELWSDFAGGGTGIKITFEIDNNNSDFREVYYSNEDKPKKIALLEDLFKTIESEYKKPIIFTEISNIGSFYISGRFNNEKEFRFLINRDSDKYNARNLTPINYENDVTYIKLPFHSSFADFKVKSITKGPNCSAEKFKKIKNLVKKKYAYKVTFED